MKKSWNQATIQQYIDDGVEESRIIEYKAAEALDGTPSKKKEIAKDVSSMANSAGGIIIYGIQEFQEKDKKHLPEKIDPIDRTHFSRETLENIITDNIQPRIEGLTIHPVSIDTKPNDAVYVVEIPQSTTAHQVTKDNDYRYYKRFNFKSVPMADDEIRDVMNRAIVPDVRVKFRVHIITSDPDHTRLELGTIIKNQGIKVVNHYKLFVRVTNIGFIYDDDQLNIDPSHITPNTDNTNVTYGFSTFNKSTYDADIWIRYRSTDILFPDDQRNLSSAIKWGYERYHPKDDIRISWVDFVKKRGWSLVWDLYANDMPPQRGETPIYELEGFRS